MGWCVAKKSIQISLDNLISSSFFYLDQWTPDAQLKSNAAFDALRFIIIRLYESGHGRPLDTQIQLSIAAVAGKLGLSRYWTGILIHRLADAGWLEICSAWTGEKMKSSTIFKAGQMLKRLIFHLLAARRKKPHSKDANNPCQFLPRIQSIREKRQEYEFQEQAEREIKRLAEEGNPFAEWGKRMINRISPES